MQWAAGLINIDNIDECPHMDIRTKLTKKKYKDIVSFDLYVNVKERSVISTFLKYSSTVAN